MVIGFPGEAIGKSPYADAFNRSSVLFGRNQCIKESFIIKSLYFLRISCIRLDNIQFSYVNHNMEFVGIFLCRKGEPGRRYVGIEVALHSNSVQISSFCNRGKQIYDISLFGWLISIIVIIKKQNFFRGIFYIPNILSVVVISGIFSAIYKPENGMLNSIIGLFRDMTDPILWKGEKLVIPSIILAMVWQAVGYYMVMYMASMSSVPASLYESANLDGAGRLTQFFQITIPLIWTNIRTTLTFFIISTINMAFLFVKAMTSGGPNGASDVALSYMYSQKDAGLYGYSMAIGVVIFLFSFALSACVNKATDRDPLEF